MIAPVPSPLAHAADLHALYPHETPTVSIADEATGCTLWLKLEWMLPSGSTKDRLAALVLSEAVRSGQLKPGSRVVEASSGSTSIALAMACSLVGVRFRAVMPAGVSTERVLLIRRYGADVELTPKEHGLRGALERTLELSAADPAVFLTRQFENPLNAQAHELFTGAELVRQVSRPLDGFVAGVGTGGTLMGIGRALRLRGLKTVIARALPAVGSAWCADPEICGGVPGIVQGFSQLLDAKALDLCEDLVVPEEETIAAARELCQRGLPVGLSSGLNFAAARRLAKQLGPGKHIATVLCDRAERYFSTALFSDLRC
jgi:cysteine synthase A